MTTKVIYMQNKHAQLNSSDGTKKKWYRHYMVYALRSTSRVVKTNFNKVTVLLVLWMMQEVKQLTQ